MSGSEAQAGFYYQNIVAAQYALELIEFGSQLRSITLENPRRAKHIDDIIADYAESSAFIQVKWSQDDNSAFTLHNLITADEEGETPLIAKLARGFRQISNSESGSKQIVLVSTKKAGTNRQPGKGFDKSLAEFLEEFHTPFAASPGTQPIQDLPRFSEYQPILERLQSASGFSSIDEFGGFLRGLRFRLDQPDRDTMAVRVKAQLARLGIETAQYATLLDELIKWSIEGAVIHREDILRVLGLLDRFVDRIGHNFPVDRQVWVPTDELLATLDSSIKALDRGFLLLEGEPGSGKSTAFTMFQKQKPEIRFGYYCFIPHDQTLGNDRLEHEAFVSSICIGLRNAFPDVELPQPYAPHTLAQLNAWLKALSSQDRRVVFLVDGVDHVDRKSRQSLIARPLTSVLDGDVPANVLIVLSSRYMEALPAALQQHIKSDPRRHIRMPRFGSEQIRLFFKLREVAVDDKLLMKVASVSGGVPIYLEYLAERLRRMSRYEQERFLREVPPLRDARIDLYHSHLWESCKDDEILIHILAILALRDEFTTPEELKIILSGLGVNTTLARVYRGINLISHVLRVSDAKSVAIKHSSFADFVLERTHYLRDEINRGIVAWYAQAPDADSSWRHRFKHLLQIGEHAQVLAACNYEWLARAWSEHRPLLEIQRNLDIAWRAATSQQDLLAFVRIGLLKHEVALVSENLVRTEASVACLLLDMGLSEKALRRVWDGERPECGPVEFAEFVLHYVQNVGRLPPKHILEAGIGERPMSASANELKTWYRACTYRAEPVDLIAEIDRIRWRHKPSHSHFQSHLEDATNRELNREIQLSVIEELIKHKALTKLQEIRSRAPLPAAVKASAQAAVALIAIQGGSPQEARLALEGLDWSEIPVKTRCWLILKLETLRLEVSAAPAEAPQLPQRFLDNSDRNLNEELFELYDQLRVFLLKDPFGYPWLESRNTALQEPIRTLVSALGRLAKVWCSSLREEHNPAWRLSELKQIAIELDIRRSLFKPLDAYADLAGSVYEREVHRFYSLLYSCAAEHLPPDGLMEFARWWIRGDSSRRAQRYVAATRNLAFTVHVRLGSQGSVIVRELLESAEAASRKDEETSIIVAELVECAAAWGRCGFAVEAQRLWGELLNLACGVAWRKDYQFNEILPALRLAHLQAPDSTLERVTEQMALAHQLIGTSRHNTVAIAIEGIIEFVAGIYPGLALKMLEREEPFILRARAIRKIVHVLQKRRDIDLRWLIALVGSMERWSNYTDFDEETKPAMLALYMEALERRDFTIARKIYDFSRRIFLVEKEMPSDVGVWAAAWIQIDQAPSDIIQDCNDYPKLQQTENAEAHSSSEPRPEDLAWIKELDDLANSGQIEEIERRIDQLGQKSLKRLRQQGFERIRSDWRTALGRAAALEWTEKDYAILDECFDAHIELVADLPEGSNNVARDAARAILRESVMSAAHRLAPHVTTDLFERFFDMETWLDEFVRPATSPHLQGNTVGERLLLWIGTAPLARLSAWEDFCRRRCGSETQAAGFLAIAERLLATAPARAAALLTEAWKSFADFFHLYGELAKRICSTLLVLDNQKGRELLFESFRQQYQRYPGSIVYSLDTLLEFSEHLPSFDGLQLYKTWSAHNQRLTAGLSKKPISVEWLKEPLNDSFEDSCLQYFLGLFVYPVVDTRHLAFRELFHLLTEQNALLGKIFNHWPMLTDGQKEYVSLILFSLVFNDPSHIETWASELIRLGSNEHHYNIRKTIAEGIESAAMRTASLSPSILVDARQLRLRPPIVQTSAPLFGPINSIAQYPPYLRGVLDYISDLTAMDTIEEKMAMILQLMYPNAGQGFQKEVATRHRYLSNANFDQIELSGEYDGAVRAAINRSLQELIQTHRVNEVLLGKAADLLRIMDPSDVHVQRIFRPAQISWIDKDQPKDDFVSYSDIEKLKNEYSGRDDVWVTLFECTEQRIGERFGSNREYATKVRLTAFAIARGAQPPTLYEIRRELQRGGLARQRNRYRFELSCQELIHGLQVTPVVQASRRSFRGRRTPDLAAIVPELARKMGLERNKEDFFGYNKDGQKIVRSIEWQEAFDQGRRLHEPRSVGFLLQINRACLLQFTDSTGIDIWMHITAMRTADRYKPECEMKWHSHSGIFPLILS